MAQDHQKPIRKGKVIMKARNPSRWRPRTAVRLLVALATIGAGGTLIGLTGAASSASTVPHSTPVVTLQILERLQRCNRDTRDERRRHSQLRVTEPGDQGS